MEPKSGVSLEAIALDQEPTELLDQVEARVRSRLLSLYPSFLLPINLVEAAERQRAYFGDQLVGVVTGYDSNLIKRTKISAILRNYEEALTTLGALVTARAYSQEGKTSKRTGQWSQARTYSRYLFCLLDHFTGGLIPGSAVSYARTQEYHAINKQARPESDLSSPPYLSKEAQNHDNR